ncbi:hypothetical protein UAJ10_14435 [Nitrospirillum sp. BR 11164]|uniref:hypothetical protein n=1 Tax=Nitrospirillum sp. BR 11164 TaxID=3104324 RepID=UPI002AFDE164|nr:hypothetical protein [Nitrospirillum sp. BR 11164]MEA1650205.1 hypothetical protein [Nitrospirillum sp. BR 11164]
MRISSVLLPAFLATALLAAAPAHAQTAAPATPTQWMVRPTPPHDGLKLAEPQPGHLGAGPHDPSPPPAVALPLPPRHTQARIVYAFAGPASRMMTVSRDLSDACRRGRFIQRVDMLYRAFGPKESPLGVAYGTWAINLVDPDRKREVGTVYFFDKQDTARCTVYTARQDVLLPWYYGPGGGYGKDPAAPNPAANGVTPVSASAPKAP